MVRADTQRDARLPSRSRCCTTSGSPLAPASSRATSSSSFAAASSSLYQSGFSATATATKRRWWRRRGQGWPAGARVRAWWLCNDARVTGAASKGRPLVEATQGAVLERLIAARAEAGALETLGNESDMKTTCGRHACEGCGAGSHAGRPAAAANAFAFKVWLLVVLLTACYLIRMVVCNKRKACEPSRTSHTKGSSIRIRKQRCNRRRFLTYLLLC